jgi:hypothetical protein
MSSSQNPQEALIFRTFLMYGAFIGLGNLAIAHASSATSFSAFDIFQLFFILVLFILGIISFLNRAFGARWAKNLNTSLFRPIAFWWVLSICVVMIWLGFLLLLAFRFTEDSPQSELLITAIPVIRLMMLFGLLGLAYLLLQVYLLGRLESLMAKLHTHAVAVGIMFAGAAVRLLHLLFIDLRLPYISGGLFLEFSRQIDANSFHLPEIVPYYSHGGIPYAYPPLAFIVQALVLDVGGMDPIVMGNVFAPLISLLSLPLFYCLIRKWDFSPAQQLSALLVFAVMPSAFQQQVESQGTAEAFGGIALLIYGIFLLQVWRTPSWRNVLLAGFGWALSVSSAPGSGYYATLLFFLLAAAYLRRNGKDGLGRAVLHLFVLGLTAVVFSALYWGPVVETHGLKIFFNAFGAQHEGGVLESMFANLVSLGISFNTADSPISFYWDVLIVVGVLVAFTKKRWGLLVAFVLALIIPRENSWLFPITGAVLGGLSLSDLVFPAISRWGRRLNQRKYIVIFAVIAFLSLYFTTFNNILNVDLQLDEYNREHWTARLEAYSWAQRNLPKQAEVLVLTDAFSSEWAPFLMKRTVVNVLQGLEWQPEEYAVVFDLLTKLPDCLRWECVTELVDENYALEDYFIFLDSRDYPVLAEYLQETDEKIKVIWTEDEMVWLKVGIQY